MRMKETEKKLMEMVLSGRAGFSGTRRQEMSPCGVPDKPASIAMLKARGKNGWKRKAERITPNVRPSRFPTVL